MSFEWDEQKRLANLAKHSVDFDTVRLIFDCPVVEGIDDRQEYGEERIGAYGTVGDDVFFAIYPWRGNSRRIISARKAGNNERQFYQAKIAAWKQNAD